MEKLITNFNEASKKTNDILTCCSADSNLYTSKLLRTKKKNSTAVNFKTERFQVFLRNKYVYYF